MFLCKANGELVFSVKYTPNHDHQPIEHKLAIEVSGNPREFVFPFISSVEKAKIDTIMANKSILIFAGVEQETTKSITVRGSGQFTVETSDPSFELPRGLFDQNGKLVVNGDKVLTVKFSPKAKQNILIGRLTLRSGTFT